MIHDNFHQSTMHQLVVTQYLLSFILLIFCGFIHKLAFSPSKDSLWWSSSSMYSIFICYCFQSLFRGFLERSRWKQQIRYKLNSVSCLVSLLFFVKNFFPLCLKSYRNLCQKEPIVICLVLKMFLCKYFVYMVTFFTLTKCVIDMSIFSHEE